MTCLAIMWETELRLAIAARPTDITIRPDSRYPGMWRIHQGDRVSDMVNLTRAKDAAIAWARPRGLGSGEAVRWERRETPSEAPYSVFPEGVFMGVRDDVRT
jgi:hypothetical protein